MRGKVTQKKWKARGLSGRREKRASWGYTTQVDGKQVKVFNADWSFQDAMDALQARLKAAEAGQAVASQMTFGAVAEQYLIHKEREGKRSLREDRRIVGKRLLPYFGVDTPITAITAAQVAQYERKRIGEVSAYTTCNELSVLKHLLRLAKRWGYLQHLIDIQLPKKPANRERYLEVEEIARLLDACTHSKNPYLTSIVTIALNTGMRKEEILGLVWERLNLSTAMITLYRTKSGKPRSIPINADLEAALLALEPDPSKREGLLFKKRDGRRWGQVRTAFETALARADIADFRFHDLRHSFASHFAMRGGSLQDLKELLGHSDLKMTLRYAHLSTKHLRQSIERLEGLTRTVSAHRSAQSAKIGADRLVSPDAPVAQVDRAAVS